MGQQAHDHETFDASKGSVQAARSLRRDQQFPLLGFEGIPDLEPLYAEAARLLRSGGSLVLAGYHPQFLMTCGMPTHFHRPSGEPVAIETYVHLISDHVRAATLAGLTLIEMHEGLVDDEYIAGKPKWARFRNTLVSFAFAWRLA